MPFIGTTPTQGFVSSFPKQSFTPNGSTTVFTLTNPVASANDLEVFVGNVRQEPTTAYTAAGTTLTLSEAPASGLNFYVINKSFAQVTTTPPANSISTDKIVNDAVTSAKLGASAVDATALASNAVTSAKLDTNIAVAGTLGVTGVSTFAAGSNSAPSITFTGDSDTGIYASAANQVAFTVGGEQNLKVGNGFLEYGSAGGTNDYSNPMEQSCGNETLTPSSSSAGATETLTATRSLPYQKLIPCAIMVYANGNSAITWHFSTLVYSTFHASGTQVTSTVDGQGGSYFDATPTFSTTGGYDARKVTVTLNTASNSNPAAWRVLIRYGIGGPT